MHSMIAHPCVNIYSSIYYASCIGTIYITFFSDLILVVTPICLPLLIFVSNSAHGTILFTSSTMFLLLISFCFVIPVCPGTPRAAASPLRAAGQNTLGTKFRSDYDTLIIPTLSDSCISLAHENLQPIPYYSYILSAH